MVGGAVVGGAVVGAVVVTGAVVVVDALGVEVVVLAEPLLRLLHAGVVQRQNISFPS